jgi:hypothetical protein
MSIDEKKGVFSIDDFSQSTTGYDIYLDVYNGMVWSSLEHHLITLIIT